MLFDIILIIHIAGGTLALLGAPVALIAHKGNRIHRSAGKIFFWGMTLVFITSLYMGIAHLHPFLLMVGIFSYQMVITGVRSIRYKKTPVEKVASLDWFIIIVAAIADAGLVLFGLYQLTAASETFGIVPIVFGVTGLQLVYSSYRKFTGKKASRTAWLFHHIGNMMGGYIAAVTAFLVVNVDSGYPVLLWLSPAIVGGGVIAYFFSYYKRKLAAGKSLPEMVTVSVN